MKWPPTAIGPLPPGDLPALVSLSGCTDSLARGYPASAGSGPRPRPPGRSAAGAAGSRNDTVSQPGGPAWQTVQAEPVGVVPRPPGGPLSLGPAVAAAAAFLSGNLKSMGHFHLTVASHRTQCQ